MRCYICDAPLTDDEVRFNKDHEDYDPCTVCKNVIADAVNDAGDAEVILSEEDLGFAAGQFNEDMIID